MNQMKQFYLEKVVPALQQKFAYKNVMQIPRLEKSVLNMGVGAASQNRKILDEGLPSSVLLPHYRRYGHDSAPGRRRNGHSG